MEQDRIPLSGVDVEDMEELQRSQVHDNYHCNSNIYNAFLITNYRKDLQFKNDHKFIARDIKYGLGFLAYLTAIIQWAALITLVTALIIESDVTSEKLLDLSEWNVFPKNTLTLLMLPFFVIGLISTYKQFAQIWVDIHILNKWNINHGNNCHVIALKYVTELVLYSLGSFVFYVTLSWYSRDSTFLATVLKVLAYQFIFGTDEWAFDLVKDIIQRRMKSGQYELLFKGYRDDKVYRFEMMVYMTIPISIALIVQGIYSASWIILGFGLVSTILWCFHFPTYFAKKSEKDEK